MKEFFLKNIKLFLFLISIAVTILIGAIIGILLVYQKGLPQITSLEDIKPVVMTRIYDDNNMLLKVFAVEKRIILKSTDIPQIVKNSIIVSEDINFRSHWGINFSSIFRAVTGVIFRKNLGGGSTITMQLARNLFLYNERTKRTFSRKLKEILLSIQLEKKYSKDQILTFYCNKIPFGGPAYGVEAASKYYFGKTAKELTVGEAALLTAIIPSPNGVYNIFKNPDNCIRKRNLILKKLLAFKIISKKDYDAALKEALPSEPYNDEKYAIGSYFIEDIRKYLEASYGDTLLYEGGLKVHSTLNREMQIWAEKALREGLRNLDKRKGWRIKNRYFNLIKNKLDLKLYAPESWKSSLIEDDEVLEGIITDISRRKAVVRIKDFKGILPEKNARWTKWRLNRILKKGKIALLGTLRVNKKKKTLTLYHEKEPAAEGAILVA